jgi:hypothetical protein
MQFSHSTFIFIKKQNWNRKKCVGFYSKNSLETVFNKNNQWRTYLLTHSLTHTMVQDII